MFRFVTTCLFAILAIALFGTKAQACELLPLRPAKAVLNVAGNAVDRTHGLFRGTLRRVGHVGHRTGFGRVYYHTVEPPQATASKAECVGPNCPAPTAAQPKASAPVGTAAPKAVPKK